MINATLIVQLINFFLAYLLIERILLRKVVPIIQHDQQEQTTLMQGIQQGREDLDQKELLKEKKWSDFRTVFAQKIPKKQEIMLTKIPDISLEIPIGPVEAQQYSDQLEKIVMQKVIDGI